MNALEEAEGDETKAIEILRKKGAASASKRSGRNTAEGVVSAYTHMSGTGERKQQRIGVLVEVLCETDFVALNDDFKEFAHDVAVHIAAMNRSMFRSKTSRRRTSRTSVASSRRRRRGRASPMTSSRRSSRARSRSWASEIVLLDQPHFNEEKYEGKTIEDLRAEVAAKTGRERPDRPLRALRGGTGLGTGLGRGCLQSHPAEALGGSPDGATSNTALTRPDRADRQSGP